MEAFWGVKESEVLDKLQSSGGGLTGKEAKRKLRKWGANVVGKRRKRTAVGILWLQLNNWLMLTLLVATGVAWFLGEKVDAAVILGVVGLSVVFGFLQEFRAERTIEKLQKYISQRARVLRDGRWEEISSKEVVVGDVVELRLGDRVAADTRLLFADNLTVDEAILTGESLPVNKEIGVVEAGAEMSGRKNMVWAGSYIGGGVGKGVVVATGESTFLGETAREVEEGEQETEFQKQIRKFSNFLFKVILVMAVFVFLSNAILGKGTFPSFLFAVALAVGITPELLPIVITVTLSQGAMRMAKKKVIVKKLVVIEDLGNVDILCTDKTGTLTEGKFGLSDYLTVGGERNEEVLLKAVLCSSGMSSKGRLSVNQVDRALWESAKVKELQKQLGKFEVTDENEFDFERKRMSVVVNEGKGSYLLAKGSMETMLKVVDKVRVGGEVLRLSEEWRGKIKKTVRDFESQGLRVMAVAEKKVRQKQVGIKEERKMSLVGLITMTDPVKATAGESIDLLRRLGVRIKVMSGDSAVIVKKVAREVGLWGRGARVVEGKELEGLSEAKLSEVANKETLFARVTPELKYRLVKSLNREEHVVAFLGDGVNDAPALKAADVGIAVDSGAAVAKEAADIVLLKKDLRVLGEGIEAGRKTFGNVTKYILNTISANYGNMVTVAASSLFLRFIPLLPAQILLNNFLSDVPLLAVATDNVDSSFVKRPRHWDIKMIGEFMVYFGIISSVFDLLLILPLIFWWKSEVAVFRTAWFVESLLSEVVVTFAIRTRGRFYRSRPSLWLIGLSILASGVAIVLPTTQLGQRWFGLVEVPFAVKWWIAIIVVGYFGVTEVAKGRFFKKWKD